MDFDSLLLQILDEFIDGKKIDVDAYCKKYPQFKDSILSKFRTAEFIKKNLHEEDLSGKKLGEYLILQELGRGGMGIVFLGVHPALSRLTAIKVLPPSFAQDKDVLKNFQEEAKIIAKFNHPNIVPIYSISDEKGVFYIAMGYISGLSLKSVVEILKTNKEPGKLKATVIKEILQAPPVEKQDISQKSITLKRGFKFWDMPYFKFVATIGAEIADALSYAHHNSIIHGDLKPSNILLTNEAIPMVLDFGLSRNIKKLASSRSKEFSGTLAYAAPEQIKENIINEKTDIWSLGVTLYELLTFRNPFVDKTVKKTADKIVKGNPIPLRSYNKKIPIELEAIVLKCLESEPENRYETILEVARDLSNYLELKPIKAKPSNLVGRFIKTIRRQPKLSAITVALIAALLITPPYIYNRHMYSLLEKALNLRRVGKNAEAESIYQKIIKSPIRLLWMSTVRESAFIGLGEIYYFYNEDDKSNKFVEEALKINPYNTTALFSMAIYYDARDQYSKAADYYKRILDLNPSEIMVIDKYAKLLWEMGLWEDALEFLAQKCKTKTVAENILIQLTVIEIISDELILSSNGIRPPDAFDKIKRFLVSKGFDETFADLMIVKLKEHYPRLALSWETANFRPEGSDIAMDKALIEKIHAGLDQSQKKPVITPIPSTNEERTYVKKRAELIMQSANLTTNLGTKMSVLSNKQKNNEISVEENNNINKSEHQLVLDEHIKLLAELKSLKVPSKAFVKSHNIIIKIFEEIIEMCNVAIDGNFKAALEHHKRVEEYSRQLMESKKE